MTTLVKLGVAGISLAALACVCALGACSSSDVAQCRVGADCASGACDSSGHCLPVTTGDSQSDAPVDLGADVPPYDAGDAGPTDGKPPGCTPNGDGTITAAEVPLGPGLKATYRAATDVTVSTAGTPIAGGLRRWDFSAALTGDRSVIIETLPMAGKWYTPKFAAASYAAQLSATKDLLGVFQVGTSALSLLGVVSPADGMTRTELTYASAITVLQFPLSVGTTWSSTSAVNGLTSGALSTFTEKYDSKVDARGEVVTPFGTFPALRVRTVLTRTLGVIPTVTRTFVYMAECFGPVATVVSGPNETVEEFTAASEIRRLSP